MMSTYNGEKYLKEQVNSILNQKEVSVHLIVRDDGSTDNTLKILNEYQKEGKLEYYKGRNLGPAKSFLDIINSKSLSEIQANYFAFSDQDDIWKSDKLIRAINIISTSDEPYLYCADFQRIDQDGRYLKNNFHFTTSTFNQSVVCSYCTGCTMVFNYSLLEKIRIGKPDYLLMHDDWIHKVCLAIGGKVFFDREYRAVLYRQHEGNVVGSRAGLTQKIKNLYKRSHDQKDCMYKEYAEIMEIYKQIIPKPQLDVINQILEYKKKNVVSRLKWCLQKKFRIHPIKLAKEFVLGILFKFY
ncbi:glycosyltransferase [Lactobacillus ultunensis]|nr:glycosyltransferase [Lactobacillus ultunensis]